MPNKKYVAGRNKEYKVINEAKEKGFVAFRSAGSHSPIDVCIIDPLNHRIYFVQCKPDSMSSNQKFKIEQDYIFLNGTFEVTYEVR